MKQDKYPDMYAPSDRACIPQETVINNVQLANAYVPFEKLCTTYTPARALFEGTAFPELYSAYERENKFRFEGDYGDE